MTREQDSQVETRAVDTSELDTLNHVLANTDGVRLADMFATNNNGQTVLRLIYAFEQAGKQETKGHYLILESPIVGELYPPCSDIQPAAFVEECEIFEQYHIRPNNDKPLNRLTLLPKANETKEAMLASHLIQGEAFEFPFGPVRTTASESLYMGLVTTGEELLDIYLFWWHKYRGMQRRLVGLDIDKALFFVERTDGLSAFSNSLAFCRALEQIYGLKVSSEVSITRAIAVELERIYNHAAAVAAICQSTGLSVAQASAEIALEDFLRLNLETFGHRYLFNLNTPGGIRSWSKKLTPTRVAEALSKSLPRLCSNFFSHTESLLKTNSFVDRLEATGIIDLETAKRLGLVGPVARGSGYDIDTRRDHSYPPYTELTPKIPTEQSGDVFARVKIMVEEVKESQYLIQQFVKQLSPKSSASSPLEHSPSRSSALGWCESARGETLCWVELGADGRIRSARIRPASVRGWRAFDDAARSGNVFTDVPIIEASFWLTVAGMAR
ncbi:MAG: hypothetical protein M1483_08410 [Actinobacteria bacterium]|nr:hypothetical protein [Actinomycetota bacterium]